MCFLTGTFSAFTFKVIIDRLFIAILNLVCLLILYFLICPFLFSLLWFDDFLLYCVCVLFLVFMNLLYV